MGRGSHLSMIMMPAYLTLFDAEDGHEACARRERSISAPQVLFMLNGELAQNASKKLAKRLESEAPESPAAKAAYGYKLVLGRQPSAGERDLALSYLQSGDAAHLEGFSWMLLNLSEFVFLP
jgi:predicted alpha/beta superfamily hydrolase